MVEETKEEGIFSDKINRRTFIKGSAVAGVGTVVGMKLLGKGNIFKTMEGGTRQGGQDEWLPTTCWVGKQDCGMLARIVDGRIVKLEGHPDHPVNKGRLCLKGTSQLTGVYDPYRIKAPLKRTNAKGVPGEWTEITWDEALTTTATKATEAMAVGSGALVWQKGRSKAKDFYDDAFVKSTGALKMHHGAYCSDGGYRAMEYTIGRHGVIHPDFRHCNYMLNLGWGITTSGGNKTCWLTWPQHLVEARERGMKVITVDPQLRGAGPHTDEWLPIKPGTDIVLLNAIANILIAEGYVDEPYLKYHTNSPYLVNSDGTIYRNSEDKELVWDSVTNSAQPFDGDGVEPTLDGTFGGRSTGFALYKAHVSTYTAQYAEEITGIPAATVTRIANELGENAMIGSNITLEGEEYAYRPVGLMAYHICCQELGFQLIRAAAMVYMMLGAIEAVGGLRSDYKRATYKKYASLNNIEIKDPPYNLYLKDSQYYPINSNNSSIAALHLLDPAAHGGIDQEPTCMIVHNANPVVQFPNTNKMGEAFAKIPFIAVVDPWMSETADYYGDIVMPAATMEKIEGPMKKTDQYDHSIALRLPVIPPLFKSRGEIDIYLDLCEKMEEISGTPVLTGDSGYIHIVNKELKLNDTVNELDESTRPTVRGIFDAYAKEQGVSGIDYFEEHGVIQKGAYSASTLYAKRWDKKDVLEVHRLYGEKLLDYQKQMIGRGVSAQYYQDYTAFPTWREPTMNRSPAEYDMVLISTKLVEFKQSRSTWFTMMLELEPEQVVMINPVTASAKGIKDGEMVTVTSHNAITSETMSVVAKAKLVDHIRPDVVDMPNHYGLKSHPRMKGRGPTPNELFFSGPGYVTNTADQSFHVKVKIVPGGA